MAITGLRFFVTIADTGLRATALVARRTGFLAAVRGAAILVAALLAVVVEVVAVAVTIEVVEQVVRANLQVVGHAVDLSEIG